MQSWQNQAQNGDDSWQQNFFADENGQYDHAQDWSQPQDSFGGHMDVDATGFLDGPQSMLPDYDAHGDFDLGNQFSGQDAIDPAFDAIQQDLYPHQTKMNIGGVSTLDQMNHVQAHPQPSNQGFQHQDYPSFASPSARAFNTPSGQYSQSQLVPQTSRQGSHTPVQQFSNIQPGLGQPHPLPRATQHSPAQSQSPYPHSVPYSGAVNNQTSTYPTNHSAQTFQQPHPNYTPSTFASIKPYPYPQSTQAIQGQNFAPTTHQREAAPASLAPAQNSTSQQPIHLYNGQAHQIAVDAPAKKRQRLSQAASESPVPDSALARLDSPLDSTFKRMDDIDDIPVPEPTAEETFSITQFGKRTKSAQNKFPAIKGLPHLLHDATIRLPAPKSYDKLSPLVALPPRSKKQIIPELGHSLPCEIQGRFTMQYRPAPDNIGLDERRMEGKELLDAFERSMKALGKKRPKYTEYPHAFKEQLKADEASKNKAGKKARKEQEEERVKPVRTATRPIDPIEAAVWDIIGIVHIDQSVIKTNSIIATRVQQAGDLFIKLRSEMNKAKQEIDQAVEDKKPGSDLDDLKRIMDSTRDALYRALDAAVEYADDSVMDNLGGHQKLVLSLVNMLISSIKANDFTGKLPKVVLELFTHLSMTKKIAETKNFDTVRKKFADKGDKEIKELVAEISTSVRKAMRSAEPATATGYAGTSAASRAKSAATTSKPSAGGTSTKRSRDDDGAVENRSVKKIAVEPGTSSLGKKMGQPKLQLQSASKTLASKSSTNSVLPGKPRIVAKSAPKPDIASFESSTLADAQTRVEAKKSIKPEARAVGKPEVRSSRASSPPAGGSLSGIASLLDSISSAKQEAQAPKEIGTPEMVETPDERSKRLRKEARRKLRVTWKPESELVQVKVFEKEEEEDGGKGYNMVRDAADDHAEGMVLKQRADVDEEDDDEDVPYQPWSAPFTTDLSNLASEIRNKNYTTRGGSLTFTTDEMGAIAKREQTELMAIYADVDDVPPSPKSPAMEATVPATEQKVIHLPQDIAEFEEIHQRWRDEQQVGLDGALYSATQRIDRRSSPAGKLDSILAGLQGPSASQAGDSQLPAAQGAPGDFDTNIPLIKGVAVGEQILVLLRSALTQDRRGQDAALPDLSKPFHYSDAASQAAGQYVEALVKKLAGKAWPATEPPEWLLDNEERVREWWHGFHKEAATKLRKVEEEKARADAARQAATPAPAAFAQNQAQNQQDWTAYYAQLQQQYPYMALPGQTNGAQQQASQPPQAAAPQGQDQLNALLAAMGQAQPPQQQQSQAQAYLNPNDPSYAQLSALMQMGQNSNQAQPSQNHNDRDRDWDREDEYGRNDRYGDKDRGQKDYKKKVKTAGPSTIHKPVNMALIGTKPCTFWQQGKCARGDKCTFRHD